MTSVPAPVPPSPLPSISSSSGLQLSISSSVKTTSQDSGVSTGSQVQSMTSLTPSTPIKATPTSKSIQATMPNDTVPTVTTESSSKTPIKLPTTSTSSSTRITSHSTTSVSSSHDAAATTSTRSLQTSQKPQVTSPIVPPRTTTAISLEGVPSSRSTRTSTITDQPESTFSRIVAVTLTSNGTVSISTPIVVTVLSTSTLPDGDFVTYTHVVANPTGFIGGTQALKNNGFLGNHGAMAGVFVVVGIVVAAIGLCFTFFFRRHLRRNRRRRWLEGMHQQEASASHNPFEDPDDTPHMRTFADEPVLVDWNDRAPGGSLGARNSMHSSSSQRHSAVGLVGVGSGMRSTDHQMHSGELWGDTRLHGLSLPFDHNLFHSRASIAQSSPSIYPASLPPDVDGNNAEVARQTEMPPSPPPQNPFVAEAPPRPPRSILRRNSMRAPAEMYPMTPPASASSHSHSKPPSPIVDQAQSKGPQDVLNRRTLLDLRPRTSDSVTGEAF